MNFDIKSLNMRVNMRVNMKENEKKTKSVKTTVNLKYKLIHDNRTGNKYRIYLLKSDFMENYLIKAAFYMYRFGRTISRKPEGKGKHNEGGKGKEHGGKQE